MSRRSGRCAGSLASVLLSLVARRPPCGRGARSNDDLSDRSSLRWAVDRWV